jgi:hypothetical protein
LLLQRFDHLLFFHRAIPVFLFIIGK